MFVVVGDGGEEAERRNGGGGGRGEVGEVGDVVVRIGAKRGLSGAEEDDVESGESAGEGEEEGERSVVNRLVGWLGRGEGVRMVVAEADGREWLADGGRGVCRLVWVCILVFEETWREIWEVLSMKATRRRSGHSE